MRIPRLLTKTLQSKLQKQYRLQGMFILARYMGSLGSDTNKDWALGHIVALTADPLFYRLLSTPMSQVDDLIKTIRGQSTTNI